MKIGFDNDKYLALQAEHIKERRSQFGDKLYLEFGGKLFDDYHASRVLPGFQPDSKIRMLAAATSASPTTRTSFASSTSSAATAWPWRPWSSPSTPASPPLTPSSSA